MLPLWSAAILLQLAGHPPADGETMLRAAIAKYDGQWYHTKTFVQKSTHADGSLETWYEAMELPGKLRIDIAPASNGRAQLFRHDSVYVWQGGQLRASRPLVHPLLLILYDMHFLPADTTIARLKGLGFDLGPSHEGTWNGTPVIVVGAVAGDTTTSQIWFEKSRMLPVRMIQSSARGVQDTRIGGYQRAGKAWGETEITFYVNGVLQLREEYTEVKVGMTQESGLFEPTGTYKQPAWIGEGAVVFK